MTGTLPDSAWRELETAVGGDVVRPGAADYDTLRRPAIPRPDDVRPAADRALRRPAGRRRGARLRPVGAVAGGGPQRRALLRGPLDERGRRLDVSPLAAVAVAGERATIGAGARLGDVYDALDAHGLTIPAGCGPTVGIAGLTLGGGLGILGRLHGLTSDSLRAAQVVLADGRVVTCDADDGGGPVLGAARRRRRPLRRRHLARLRDDPGPAHDRLRAGVGARRRRGADGAWQEWAPAAPDAIAASLLLNTDGGTLRVRVFGAMAASEAETTRRLDELAAAAGADPTAASVRTGSYREAKRFLSGLGEADEEDAGHPFSKSEFIAQRLPSEAIDALLAHLRTAPAAAELDFSPWGGAYTRVAREATAFAHRTARFLLKHAIVVDPDATAGGRAAARDWLARSWELAHPFGTGGVYPNFPDPDLDDWDAAYHGANRERLLAVKRRYDPDGVFGAAPR